jgi:predicted nucleic acid-binding protein
MKEIVQSLERTEQAESLLDTCFLLYQVEHHHEKQIKGAITSFNAEELVHVSHKISAELKLKVRHFLKRHSIKVVDIPVQPGDREGERRYVEEADSELLKEVHDPSDAVLIAAAVKKGVKTVYTRDKHHLYTAELENYLSKYGITVLNKY